MHKGLFHPGSAQNQAEQSYRQFFLAPDTKLAAICIVVWQFPVVAFARSDFLIFGWSTIFFVHVAARILFILCSLFAVAALLRTRNPLTYDWLVFVLTCVGASLNVFINVERPHDHVGNVAIDVLLLLSLYIPLYNRLLFKILPALILTIGNSLVLICFRTYANTLVLQATLVSYVVANVLGVLISLQIESSRRRQFAAQKQLAESNLFKSRFLAVIGHELRTPLNAILGFAEMGLRKSSDPDVTDCLSIVRSSSRALLESMNNILDFAKVEEGKIDLESVAFDPDAIMERLTDLFVGTMPDRDVELYLDIEPRVPRSLVGDPLRLQQVLNNLTANALKFTKQGEVSVRMSLVELEQDRARVKFSVTDTGIGLSPEQIERLFKPFSQADAAISREFGGTGLGLAICKSLVQRMGGDIRVQSSPGQGSTFEFVVPLGVQPKAAVSESVVPDTIKRSRILVVDDSATSREIMTGMLQSLGFRVVAAGSGGEALDRLPTEALGEPFTLVFLDWNMPSMDGVETFRRMRQEKTLSTCFPKTILMVPFQRADLRELGIQEGVDAVLTKPLRRTVLANMLPELLASDRDKVPERKHGLGERGDAGPSLLGLRVLLVEDNRVNQKLVSLMLGKAGAEVSIAASGAEAIRVTQDSLFDVVLMDVEMPVMDGLAATRIIRADERFRYIPIIAITADSSEEMRAECIAAGMNECMEKWADPQKLVSILALINSAEAVGAAKERS